MHAPLQLFANIIKVSEVKEQQTGKEAQWLLCVESWNDTFILLSSLALHAALYSPLFSS
jgi:hypothetical protein